MRVGIGYTRLGGSFGRRCDECLYRGDYLITRVELYLQAWQGALEIQDSSSLKVFTCLSLSPVIIVIINIVKLRIFDLEVVGV